MRGDRLLEQPAVAARVDEAGEELGVVAVAIGFAEQTDQRILRLADVRFEVGVVLVRDRQARAEREGAPEGVLGERFAVAAAVDVLADDAVAAAEPRPCRGEPRIEIEAALIELARRGHAVVVAGELVAAKIELVRARVVRHVGRVRRNAAAKRQRQRLRDPLRDVVLQSEQIAERGLHGV
jgi:hypothetical protein